MKRIQSQPQEVATVKFVHNHAAEAVSLAYKTRVANGRNCDSSGRWIAKK